MHAIELLLNMLSALATRGVAIGLALGLGASFITWEFVPPHKPRGVVAAIVFVTVFILIALWDLMRERRR